MLVRVYERYSLAGGNRVSMSVSVLAVEGGWMRSRGSPAGGRRDWTLTAWTAATWTPTDADPELGADPATRHPDLTMHAPAGAVGRNPLSWR
jgi:hypothetical protein